MILYHITTEDAAKKAKKSNLGLDKTDYIEWLVWASTVFDVPLKKLLQIDIFGPEMQGSVSFWPDKKKAVFFADYYNRRGLYKGGEAKQLFIRQLVRKICRYKRIPINSEEGKLIRYEIENQLQSSKELVVIEVNVPLNFISNKEDIGKKR